MLALAWPVVVAELGWMSMGVVDTIMVGRIAPEAIGAVGLGSTLYVALGIFGMGLLLGLDTLVSHAFGATSLDECHRWLLHGVYLALIVSPALILLALGCARTMPAWGLHPAVLDLAQPYFETLTWGTVPLLLYAAFRRYLQAMNRVRPIVMTLLSANLVNALGNWVLVFGHLGFAPQGTRGSAWATVIARAYMAGALVLTIVWRERHTRTGLWAISFRPELNRLRALIALGGPAATQLTAEVGIFAAATVFAARLEPIALAAHQIALNVASVTYMVPLGIASAGAVRVGQALGRGDPIAAGRSGWMALAIGVGSMTCAALALLAVPEAIIRLFTDQPAVITTGVSLLLIAATFQLFDGLQTVATGVLRGLGDTRTPMLSNLAGHWLLGLPVGYGLCFWAGWGVSGVWIGLSLGLIVVAIVLVGVWVGRIRALRSSLVAVPS
jgi:multidrug resistance protein, MATE family